MIEETVEDLVDLETEIGPMQEEHDETSARLEALEASLEAFERDIERAFEEMQECYRNSSTVESTP